MKRLTAALLAMAGGVSLLALGPVGEANAQHHRRGWDGHRGYSYSYRVVSPRLYYGEGHRYYGYRSYPRAYYYYSDAGYGRRYYYNTWRSSYDHDWCD